MLNINPINHNTNINFKSQRDYSQIYKKMEKITSINKIDITIMRALARCFFVMWRHFYILSIRMTKKEFLRRIEFPIRHSTKGCNVLQGQIIFLYILSQNNLI